MHMQEKHSGKGLSVRLIATGQEKSSGVSSGKSSQGLASLQKGSQLAAGSGGSPDYAEGDRVRHVKFGEEPFLRFGPVAEIMK